MFPLQASSGIRVNIGIKSKGKLCGEHRAEVFPALHKIFSEQLVQGLHYRYRYVYPLLPKKIAQAHQNIKETHATDIIITNLMYFQTLQQVAVPVKNARPTPQC